MQIPKLIFLKNLTPGMEMQSILARYDDGTPVVVKMMDEKRAVIYRILAENPGPYIANVYCVSEIPERQLHSWLNFTNPSAGHDADAFQDSQLMERKSMPDSVVRRSAGKTGSAGNPCLFAAVTEYAGDCTLEKYVEDHGGRIGETEALGICKMICEALIVPHEKGIVHRDIKPENIMVCRNPIGGSAAIKLIDFGASKLYDQNRIADTTIVGSFGFQAPESLTSSTDERTDIYSIGCVLQFMLTGTAPGQTGRASDPGDEVRTGGRKTMKTKWQDTAQPQADGVRIGIREIIEKCTNVNSGYRYQSVYELIKALRHEMHEGFINSIPFIREIPGYRTQTLWKMKAATVYYSFMIFWICISIRGNMLDNGLFCVFFWCILPLFICGNAGHVYRFVPRGIRLNNRLFLIIRVVLAVICFFIPITVP